MYNAKGERLKVGFDGSIKLEFHGAKVTSDGELFAYKEMFAEILFRIERLRCYSI